jgi:hypothetical protein
MWKVVIALCLFSSQGDLLEHTLTDSVSDCLEKKRVMERNMPTTMISCGQVEAELEELQGKVFIKSIRKMEH